MILSGSVAMVDGDCVFEPVVADSEWRSGVETVDENCVVEPSVPN